MQPFKTIYGVQLCWFIELCLLGDLNGSAEASLCYQLDALSMETWTLNMQNLPCVHNEFPWQETILWVSPSYWLELSCLGDLNRMQRLPCGSGECPLQDHLPSKPIILTQWTISPGRPEQWMCRGFPSVTDKWPFQDYLPINTVISAWWTLPPRIHKHWMCRDVLVSVMSAT